MRSITALEIRGGRPRGRAKYKMAAPRPHGKRVEVGNSVRGYGVLAHGGTCDLCLWIYIGLQDLNKELSPGARRAEGKGARESLSPAERVVIGPRCDPRWCNDVVASLHW